MLDSSCQNLGCNSNWPQKFIRKVDRSDIIKTVNSHKQRATEKATLTK